MGRVELEPRDGPPEPAWTRPRRESFRVEATPSLVLGDEVWESHTAGYPDRRGHRGLALVRRGHVVKLWWPLDSR